jgi:hypothetical protein
VTGRAVAAVADPDDGRGRRIMDADAGTRAAHSGRRNVRMFWAHILIALGFLAAFVWVTVHR